MSETITVRLARVEAVVEIIAADGTRIDTQRVTLGGTEAERAAAYRVGLSSACDCRILGHESDCRCSLSGGAS